MSISIFDLFSIGLGPSSSHTMGPMRAALRYIHELQKRGLFTKVEKVVVDLYGSLALTGKGHATDVAILLGLSGETPEGVDPDQVDDMVKKIREGQRLSFGGKRTIAFDEIHDLLFHKEKQLPYHPNGMRFTTLDEKGHELFENVYYSVGGGFVIDHTFAKKEKHLGDEGKGVPFPFSTSAELLAHCHAHSLRIDEVVWENELTWRTPEQIRSRLFEIWEVMKQCVMRGIASEGILPGGLKVRRRAPALYRQLMEREKQQNTDIMEWLSLWALAVNEENAAGGRVVTAPTNGAAGIIPSVLHYYMQMADNPTNEGMIKYFLTAGAIGILYKEGASISAAEMGCMGEVGVACSMAAAALSAALGGTVNQIENSAEIGMEHNLGLTCDPIKGLVQIPCIERNTMGAVKAVNAALLSLRSDGQHHVSLDQVIATMRATGRDMQSIYKETSLGGLAVNVPEC